MVRFLYLTCLLVAASSSAEIQKQGKTPVKFTDCMSTCTQLHMTDFCHNCINHCSNQMESRGVPLINDNKYYWGQAFDSCVERNGCKWSVCKPKDVKQYFGFRDCRQNCKRDTGLLNKKKRKHSDWADFGFEIENA